MVRVKLTGKVQTVLGLISADSLGKTLPHEHLMADISSSFVEPASATEKALAYQSLTLENLSWVRYYLDNNLDNRLLQDEQLAINEALLYKQAGGTTIVEVTRKGLGRNPLAVTWIARATGLSIVMGTA